jgi:hypothetical protein
VRAIPKTRRRGTYDCCPFATRRGRDTIKINEWLWKLYLSLSSWKWDAKHLITHVECAKGFDDAAISARAHNQLTLGCGKCIAWAHDLR